MMQKISTKFRWDQPSTEAPNVGGIGKNCFFLPVEKSLARTKNSCPFPTVVRVHDGALVEEYAVSSTTLVVVVIWWSQLRSSWHQPGWLYESLLMTPMYVCHSEHRMLTAVVELTTFSTLLRVQSYAGSRIKRGSCWKRSSGWHAICWRYSYNSMTTHFNWNTASHGSRGGSWASC